MVNKPNTKITKNNLNPTQLGSKKQWKQTFEEPKRNGKRSTNFSDEKQEKTSAQIAPK